MTGVYFPSHVFLLFRRFVNVVSTLSLSKHCISSIDTTHSYSDNVHSPKTYGRGDILNSLGDYPHRLEATAPPGTVEGSQNWPWWQMWDSALLGTISGAREGNTLYSRNPGKCDFFTLFYDTHNSIHLRCPRKVVMVLASTIFITISI